MAWLEIALQARYTVPEPRLVGSELTGYLGPSVAFLTSCLKKERTFEPATPVAETVIDC